MSETTCTACLDRPARDSFLCQPCQDQLVTDLQSVPDVAEDLHVEHQCRARRSSGPTVVPTGNHTPLPVNLAAGNLLHELRFALSTACLAVAITPDRLPDWWTDRPPLGVMAQWLITWRDSLILRAEAGNMAIGLHRLLRRARWLIDNRPERAYVGACSSCDTALYAPRDLAVVECPDCGTQWEAEVLRDALNADLADTLLTVTELAILLRLPRSRISMWASRGRMEPKGGNRDGVRVYRYGDALTLAAQG